MRNAMSVSKLKYATLKNSSGRYNWTSTNQKEPEEKSQTDHSPLSLESTGGLHIPETSSEEL